MPTENTSLKNTTPAGDSNTTNAMVIGKINTYQRSFLIVASSLLALLVMIAFSAAEIAKGGTGALAEYQVDNTNSALIFGFGGHPVNDPPVCCRCGLFIGTRKCGMCSGKMDGDCIHLWYNGKCRCNLCCTTDTGDGRVVCCSVDMGCCD